MNQDSNINLYKSGLLDTLLNHANNFPEISHYLQCETAYLHRVIEKNELVVDFGCGYGRHLQAIETSISYGLGIDISREYIETANKENHATNLHFQVADVSKVVGLPRKFTTALCMYNTLGNIKETALVISLMRQSIVSDGQIIISVFSDKSIESRIAMYNAMGLKNPIAAKGKIMTDEGFCSHHFTKNEIGKLLPNAIIHECSSIGWIVHSRKCAQ